MARPRTKVRQKWISVYGSIEEGLEVHHKLPVHAGGSDDIDNLELVSKEDHKQRHLDRYAETGDFRELCSYHMIGYNFSEAHRISSSEGGKIGGKKVYEEGIGIFRSEEDRKEWASLAGKVGASLQMKNKLGIHGRTKEERLMWSSIGGKIGGFTRSDIQSANGKRGGPKNKGFRWYNDNKNDYKYTKRQQEILSFDDFLQQNPNFYAGRH